MIARGEPEQGVVQTHRYHGSFSVCHRLSPVTRHDAKGYITIMTSPVKYPMSQNLQTCTAQSNTPSSASICSFHNTIKTFIVQSTAILAATAACTALPAQSPAGVEYTQVLAADIPQFIILATPDFNEKAVVFTAVTG